MADVVVSVIVVTYNHEPFIEAALDSVLAQDADWPVEILVSEDASTDRTRDIVQDYAERHSDQVRLLLSASNLNSNEVTARAVAAARGRYLAIMDGDDYWTSPDKLQKQVAFLETRPECAVCFHDVAVVDVRGQVLAPDFVRKDVPPFTDLDDILVGNFVPGCAAMIRAGALRPLPAWFADAPYGDWALLILAARQGRLGFLQETLGAYRRHRHGVWSKLDEVEQATGIVRFYDFLEPHVWPDRVTFLRRVRAGWRVNLLNTLDRQGDHDAVMRELEEGVRQGDVATTRPASGTDRRPGLAVRLVPGETTEHVPAVDDRPAGHLDEVRWSNTNTRLIVYGWGPFADDDPGPVLTVESRDAMTEMAAVRLPRPDVAKLVDPSLERCGFWIYVVADEGVQSPVRISSVDSTGTRRVIGLVAPPG